MTSAHARLAAFRRSRPRAPRRERITVRARGVDFAVWRTPPVEGAPPCLLVNGGLLFSHSSLWPSFAPLADGRQLIFYDQRGRGETPPPPGARTARIEYDAGDVVALREALGIEQWDVLGHSWGAGIAMLAVVSDQAALRKLVLVDPVGPTSWWLPRLHHIALERLSPGPDRDQLAALDPVTLTEPDPAIHSAYARAFSPAWFAEPELAPLFLPPWSDSVTGAAVASRLRRDGYDWRDRVGNLSRPALVIHGQQDPLPVQAAQEVVALLGSATLELIPGAGHMPFWERPDAFFPRVTAFLDE